MQNEKLKAIFDKFSGREVATIGNKNTPPFPGFNATVKLDPKDPAIAELRQAVEAAGFSLRIWLPNGVGTMDYRTDRVNVHVGPDMGGVYRMGGFKVG